MTDRPQPPVPPECSMRGNDWFPLHFDRLRKSRWWRRASDTARARNVMLWGEAYKAQPAGSLPDDDDELAEAAGYGMDVDAFLAAKAEIMSPWTLCADGRWYHPTLCEVVLDGWERLSERRRREAKKKRDQRARARGVPANHAHVPNDIDNVPGDTGENTRDNDTQDKTGQNPPNPPVGGASVDLFEETFAAYPEAGRKQTPPDCAREAWDDTLAQQFQPQAIRQAVAKICASPPDRIPRFDRWLTKGLWLHYRPKAEENGARTWNGPPPLRAALVSAMGEAWVRAWIDAWTTYRDLPKPPALIAANAFALGRISQQSAAMDVLRAHGVELRKAEAAA